MDVRSYEAGQVRNERIRGTTKVGQITKKVGPLHERKEGDGNESRPTGEKDERMMVGQSKGCYQREGTIG